MNEMKQLAEQVVRDSPSESFTNKHGEKFTIYSNGVFVLMGGDEVNTMVNDEYKNGGLIGLFNDHFNIWSPEELSKLGTALHKLGEKNIARNKAS